eukprot:scaffold1991_cov19-Tisochrysis_lutea.AAC.2
MDLVAWTTAGYALPGPLGQGQRPTALPGTAHRTCKQVSLVIAPAQYGVHASCPKCRPSVTGMF